MLDRIEVFIFETREVGAISIGAKKSVDVTKSLIGSVTGSNIPRPFHLRR